jgi:hypothetical protein
MLKNRHLHDMYSIGKNLKAKVEKGQLELEVRDFIGNKTFRVLAFDNDIFSFIDVKLNEYPIILLTNPKDCRYLSEYEPLNRMKSSTHIRMLIFSPKRVSSIKIFIDGVALNSNVENVLNSNLYVARWIPQRYENGVHKIKVEVESIDLKNFVEYDFSLDGSTPELNEEEKIAKFLLTNPSVSIVQMIFIILYIPVLSILVIPKGLSFFYRDIDEIIINFQPKNILDSIIRRLFILSNKNRMIHLYLIVHMIVMATFIFRYWLMGIPYLFVSNHLLVFYFIYAVPTVYVQRGKIENGMYFGLTIGLIVFYFFCFLDCLYPLFYYKLEYFFLPPSAIFHYFFSIILIFSNF